MTQGRLAYKAAMQECGGPMFAQIEKYIPENCQLSIRNNWDRNEQAIGFVNVNMAAIKKLVSFIFMEKWKPSALEPVQTFKCFRDVTLPILDSR